MSSFNRRFVLCALPAAALAGCGFAPVYGTGGVAAGLRDAIAFEAPADRNGYALIGQLETRMGRGARYDLRAEIDTGEEAVGITPEQETTRKHVTATVRYTLKDAASGAVLTSGEVSGFTGYATTGSTIATLSATRDAYERLMVMLADQIVTRLMAAAQSGAL